MSQRQRIALLSDVHYAGPSEQLRGNDYEFRDLKNPLQRVFSHAYRHFVWLRNPLEQNDLLDHFIAEAGEANHVIALGDYNCDTRFVGVSDDAALESAKECLGKLRNRFGGRLHALIGDHELGKFSMFGRRGGLRFESWRRVTKVLGLRPFWQVEIGPFTCVGVTSSLLTLPTAHGELLEHERADWDRAHALHLEEIRRAFGSIASGRRILLFCHDPSALPCLWAEFEVRNRISQIEQTFIGHLHSPFVLWNARRMAGMPTIGVLGHTAKRLSAALGQARQWEPFKLQLCPSLAGIQLLKDGGFLTAEIQSDDGQPLQIQRHRLKR